MVLARGRESSTLTEQPRQEIKLSDNEGLIIAVYTPSERKESQMQTDGRWWRTTGIDLNRTGTRNLG